MDLGLDVREQGDWTVLGVTGEIDIATAPSLRERLHSLLADGRHKLIIDLDDVGFLDSTALGVLVGAVKQARLHGGDVELRGVSPSAKSVFDVSGLSQVFGIE